jgi:hypothetical protein
VVIRKAQPVPRSPGLPLYVVLYAAFFLVRSFVWTIRFLPALLLDGTNHITGLLMDGAS